MGLMRRFRLPRPAWLPARLRLRRPRLLYRRAFAALCMALLLLGQEAAPFGSPDELLGRIVHGRGFNYWSWEFDALGGKFAQNTAGSQAWLDDAEQGQMVRDYFALVGKIQQTDAALDELYVQRQQSEQAARVDALRAQLAELRAQQAARQPFVEAIVEEQVMHVLVEEGFGPPGGVLPPVSMHFTPLPQILIVSPRDHIEPRYQIGLEHGLPVDVQVALEARSDQALGARSLVVPIGGLAMYPAMLLETTSLPFVVEATSHEWVHHWLLPHPLGYNYFTRPETRSINETVASIAGNELGLAVLRRYYPELVPAPTQGGGGEGQSVPPPANTFDYAYEMNVTRLHVDDLLAAGQIDEAEAYMEARRQVFVAHGYAIRKLNQAFFAFYGGYQAEPGGPAGADPIGPAVRSLRARAPSLREFLEAAGNVETLDQLQAVLAQRP